MRRLSRKSTLKNSGQCGSNAGELGYARGMSVELNSGEMLLGIDPATCAGALAPDLVEVCGVGAGKWELALDSKLQPDFSGHSNHIFCDGNVLLDPALVP